MNGASALSSLAEFAALRSTVYATPSRASSRLTSAGDPSRSSISSVMVRFAMPRTVAPGVPKRKSDAHQRSPENDVSLRVKLFNSLASLALRVDGKVHQDVGSAGQRNGPR